MHTITTLPRFTADGFANDYADIDGLTDYDDLRIVVKLAIAEMRMWRKAAMRQKARMKARCGGQEKRLGHIC